jgi:hypothetical protein
MTVAVSRVVVMAFGALVCALSMWGIYAPRDLIGLVKRVMERTSGIYIAIIVRLVLGAALIVTAADSRFPRVFSVFGWVAIIAAVGLAIIGRERISRFAGWFDRFSPGFVRLWLLLGLAFGGILIYGLL